MSIKDINKYNLFISINLCGSLLIFTIIWLTFWITIERKNSTFLTQPSSLFSSHIQNSSTNRFFFSILLSYRLFILYFWSFHPWLINP
nr:MAG TPA: hypothetical protein [Bacteriophage sp.]